MSGPQLGGFVRINRHLAEFVGTSAKLPGDVDRGLCQSLPRPCELTLVVITVVVTVVIVVVTTIGDDA